MSDKKTIAEIRDDVQTALISTNRKISFFSTQEKEIDSTLEIILKGDVYKPEVKNEYDFWMKKRRETGLTLTHLLFAANQMNAVIRSLEAADSHIQAYKNLKKNE